MKTGIVGSGLVGSTAAYAMVMQGVGREIVLVDVNRERALAEADDLWHAVPFAEQVQVRAGTYADLAGCAVVILSAGVNQRPGESRLQLLARNAEVFREVVPQVLDHAPEAILVVATNPVDVMTHYTARIAGRRGVPSARVLGSGTTLDTARFRALVATHCQVDPHHVHAYVVGEHGDSEVLAWSLVTIAGMPLPVVAARQGAPLTEEVRREIDVQVRKAAYRIIAGKGATYYGIGSALARIVHTIQHGQRSVLTVCTPDAEVEGVPDVTLSQPRLLGREGVAATFPASLSAEEHAALRRSAEVIRAAILELPD